MKGYLAKLHQDSLFRNSFYLMLSTGILGVFGFLFWVICSRFYSPSDIGLATSLISAATLMANLAGVGLNNSLIRFLATSRTKNEQISTSLTIVTLTSLITSAGFLIWATATKSPLLQAAPFPLMAVLFVFYVIFMNYNTLAESMFIAYRSTKYILIKNLIFSIIKLALPCLVIGFGYIGIVYSVAGATAIAFCLSLFWLITLFAYRPAALIDRSVVQEAWSFAAGNYAGNLFGMLPGTVIPIIILERLDASQTAFFYMPLMLITFLNVIPSATTQSLFAESAHDESKLHSNFKSSLNHLFLLMIPAAAAVACFGPILLYIVGKQYAAMGSIPLLILILASLIGALNYFGDMLLNIQKRIRNYIAMNALNALTILAFGYVLAPRGLAWVAVAWLIGQIVTAIVYALINWELVRDLYATP